MAPKKRLLADLHRRDRLQGRTLLVVAFGEVVDAPGEVGPGRVDLVTGFTEDGERQPVLFQGGSPRVGGCT